MFQREYKGVLCFTGNTRGCCVSERVQGDVVFQRECKGMLCFRENTRGCCVSEGVQVERVQADFVFQREYNLLMSSSEYCDEVHQGKTFATFTQQYLKEKKPFQVPVLLLLFYLLLFYLLLFYFILFYPFCVCLRSVLFCVVFIGFVCLCVIGRWGGG